MAALPGRWLLLNKYDLFQVTMKLADELQINLVPHHVKAHQDDDCPTIWLITLAGQTEC